MTAELPVLEVDRAPELAPYWEGLHAGELVLPVCEECGLVIWIPRAACPACMSADVAWQKQSGEGTVYSFTINHRGRGAFASASPYVIAYVELNEGPRLLTNIVGPVEGLAVGSRVRLAVEIDGEAAQPRFALAEGERRE